MYIPASRIDKIFWYLAGPFLISKRSTRDISLEDFTDGFFSFVPFSSVPINCLIKSLFKLEECLRARYEQELARISFTSEELWFMLRRNGVSNSDDMPSPFDWLVTKIRPVRRTPLQAIVSRSEAIHDNAFLVNFAFRASMYSLSADS